MISRRTLSLLYVATLLIAIPFSYQSGESGFCEAEHHGASKVAQNEAEAGTFYVCAMMDFGMKPWILESIFGGIVVFVVAAVSFVRDLTRTKVETAIGQPIPLAAPAHHRQPEQREDDGAGDGDGNQGAASG